MLLTHRGCAPWSPPHPGEAAGIIPCGHTCLFQDPCPEACSATPCHIPSASGLRVTGQGRGQGGHRGQWEGHGDFYSQGQSPAPTKGPLAGTAAGTLALAPPGSQPATVLALPRPCHPTAMQGARVLLLLLLLGLREVSQELGACQGIQLFSALAASFHSLWPLQVGGSLASPQFRRPISS